MGLWPALRIVVGNIVEFRLIRQSVRFFRDQDLLCICWKKRGLQHECMIYCCLYVRMYQAGTASFGLDSVETANATESGLACTPV